MESNVTILSSQNEIVNLNFTTFSNRFKAFFRYPVNSFSIRQKTAKTVALFFTTLGVNNCYTDHVYNFINTCS